MSAARAITLVAALTALGACFHATIEAGLTPSTRVLEGKLGLQLDIWPRAAEDREDRKQVPGRRGKGRNSAELPRSGRTHPYVGVYTRWTFGDLALPAGATRPRARCWRSQPARIMTACEPPLGRRRSGQRRVRRCTGAFRAFAQRNVPGTHLIDDVIASRPPPPAPRSPAARSSAWSEAGGRRA